MHSMNSTATSSAETHETDMLLMLSKTISLCILAASPLLKLQLIKMLWPDYSRSTALSSAPSPLDGDPKVHMSTRQRTARSLHFNQLIMEVGTQLIGLAFNWRHNVAITAYGEVYCLLAQNVVILCLAMHILRQHRTLLPLLLLTGAVAGSALIDPVRCSEQVMMGLLLPVVVPALTLMSMIPAIYGNYRTRSTAGFPLGMVAAGQMMGCGRIVTTCIEVSTEWPVVGSACVGPALNLILLFQVLTYPSATSATTETSNKGSIKSPSGIAINPSIPSMAGDSTAWKSQLMTGDKRRD